MDPSPRRRRPWPGWVSFAVVAVILGVVVAVWLAPRPAATSGACTGDAEEALDPRSAVGLLPNAAEPTYASDPPTSGPHVNAPGITGAVADELPRPVQVGLLQEGKVVVQHRGLADDDRRRLEAMANDSVVVAPRNDLPGPVVATAWRHRLDCRAVEPAALGQFVFRHAGRAAG
jgi:hypothetical protein